ncbi:hypothetical protein [Flavobacterium sp.]|uniref:hypothetical protein n=1 Tax=Flavobacterium sp. TaxID=239 RepID=UPI0032642D6A
MKTIQSTISILVIGLFAISMSFVSCSKSDDDSQSTLQDVYIGGHIVNSNYKWVATIWKNGVASYLTSGTTFSDINDITVAGNDVYAVGYEQITAKKIAKFWKNGVATDLSDGLKDEEAIAIAVVGNDVYVGGTQYDSKTSITIAKVWKNGIATNLESANTNYSTDVPTSIHISGNDVYVSGFKGNGTESWAKFWKNGVAVNLTNGQTNAAVNDILVVGSDVYAVGRINYKAKCWKNNVLTSNLIIEEGSYEAKRIVSEGSDIYILGYDNSVNSTSQIRIWKNGSVINSPNPLENVMPEDIAISGVDNYVCGTLKSGNKNYAVYYKNQVRTDLVTDATIASYAKAIFVK